MLLTFKNSVNGDIWRGNIMTTKMQKWQRERCYTNKGSLTSMRIRLKQIVDCKSTLIGEEQLLAAAIGRIDMVLRNWDLNRSASKAYFKTVC